MIYGKARRATAICKLKMQCKYAQTSTKQRPQPLFDTKLVIIFELQNKSLTLQHH